MSARDAYRAIADPTRREILELLRDRGRLAAGRIAECFPEVARPGISRHLRVLRECGVVSCTRTGKNLHYQLESEPLDEIRDHWLATFSGASRRSLSALRKQAEARDRY
ncbi:MAG: metalloregulator ArsR/SmtB family transcription factor [Dehalococcoidia bacterium]